MGTVFHIEFTFMHSPSKTVILTVDKPMRHGEAVKKAINDYNQFLILDAIGVSVTYIGD